MAEQNKKNGKPLPEMTPVTQPSWTAAVEQTLALQRCQTCQAWVWCPRPSCTTCGSVHLEWTEVSGRGVVYTFTIIRQVVGRVARAFEPDIPYIVAWIDLDEGPRICSNIVNCPIEQVTIGMPVQVFFDKVSADVALPKFTPLSQAGP